MSCLFTRNILYCDSFVLGGIKKVFLANRSQITSFLYDTGDTRQSQISFIVPTAVTWYEYTTQPLTTNFFEKEVITNNGRWLFQKELTCTFDYMEELKRSALMDLINSNDIVIVWQSTNGNWFLMGDDFACKVTDYQATTDTIKGNNQYLVKFAAEGRYQVRNIDTDYVNTYILPFAGILAQVDCCYFRHNVMQLTSSVSLQSVQFCQVSYCP